MSDSGSNRVSLSRSDIKAIGRSVGNNVDVSKLRSELRSIDSSVSDVSNKVEDVEDRVKQLEKRVVEVEREKARAQQSAREELLNDLKDTYEEKQRQYRRKRRQILDDYKEGIRRLKDRFISSISDQSEHFDQVSDEFEAVERARETAVESGQQTTEPMARNYEHRHELLRDSRDEFIENVDRFLEHRQETAQTIESLQTAIPGVEDAVRVDVPFWVVVAESDGRERAAVLPVMERGRPTETPSVRDPYVSYLQPDRSHDYRDLTDAVEEYVERDDVRERLASQAGGYADPSFLERNDYVGDRFLDALREFELDGEHASGGSASGTRVDAAARAGRTEATTDD
jgi:hypothetical protein